MHQRTLRTPRTLRTRRTLRPTHPTHRGFGAALPAAVEAFVLDCLRKNRDDRPQDARELLNRINAHHLAGGWSSEAAEAWWQERLPKAAAPLRSQ